MRRVPELLGLVRVAVVARLGSVDVCAADGDCVVVRSREVAVDLALGFAGAVAVGSVDAWATGAGTSTSRAGAGGGGGGGTLLGRGLARLGFAACGCRGALRSGVGL